jgi:hypothetical protein
MLTLEARIRQKQSRQRRYRSNNVFKLRDKPLSDQYVLNTGERDRYLERLREVHGEREPDP